MSKLETNELAPFSADAIGVGAPSSETTALMDFISTSKGVLPPRMTQSQRNAIASPAQGLLIFNTTSKRLETFDGTAWTGSVASNVILLSTGGTNLIGDALAGISDNSPTNPYLIYCGPGIYNEAQLQMKPYVRIEGAGDEETIIAATDPTDHLILGADFAQMSHLQLTGVTSTGKAAVFHNSTSGTTNTAFWLDNIRFGANDTHVKAVSSTGVTSVFVVNSKFGGIHSFKTGFYVLATGGFGSKIVIRNCNTTGMTAPYPDDVCISEGTGAELVMNSVQIRSGTTTAGNCIRVTDGGAMRALAINVKGFGKGIYVPTGGADPTIHAGSFLFDSNTFDLQIDHVGTMGCITACVEEAKVNKAFAAPVSMNLLDNITGNLLQSGVVKLQQQGDGFVDITTLALESASMGALEGGQISSGSGFSVDVAEGFGYLETEPEIYTKLSWNAQSISLVANEVAYLYFNAAGTLSKSASIPDTRYNIVLGRAIADSTSVFIIDDSGIDAEHTSNLFDNLFREAMGPIYKDGSIVTENGTRGLDVTAGSYFLSSRKIMPSGGTAISWTEFYRNGSGGFTVGTQSTVDNAFYDDGSGTLAPLTATYYTKHTIYTVGEAAEEQYLLVYGQAEYSALSAVETASRAVPPTYFIEGIVPIASIVVRQGSANIIEFIDERPRLGFSPSSVAAASDHGSLTGLLDDDHPQYIRVDGTRAFTGDQSHGGHNLTSVGTVNGVTIENHHARHQPGSGTDAIPTAAASTLTPDLSNAEGTSTSISRADHIHNVPADAPTTTLSPATSNSEGVGSAFARNDHTHAVATSLVGDITTIQPDDIAAAGTVDKYARGDHKHAIVAAAPITTLSPATSNAEGSGTSFARNDHTHAVATSLVGDITTIQPDDSAAAGTVDKFARGDHKHAIAAAAPTTSLSPATTNAEGVGTAFSRNDHTHVVVTALVADISTIQPDDAAAAGTADTFARGDHKHAIVAAAAAGQTPDQSSAEGASTSFARADHVHNIPTATAVGLDTTSTSTQGSNATFARSNHTHAIASGTPSSQTPDQSNAAGSSANFAKADHIHNIATAAASSISTSGTNTQGSASSFARSDHTHAVSVTNTSATATADDTTTSTTDTLINSMTLTPAAGTYHVLFTSSATNSGNGVTRNTFSIYSGGSQVAASEVPQGIGGGSNTPITTQAIVTVNGSQAIEVRWRVTAGTGTIHQRILTAFRIG